MKHVDAFLLLTSAHGATAHGERTGPFGGWTNSHLHVGTIDPVSGMAGLVKSTDGARIRTPFVRDLADGGITKLFHDGIVRSNRIEADTGALSTGAYMVPIVTQGTLRSTWIVKQ